MPKDTVRYPRRHIRIRGSVVTWTLHSKLHDALLIWVLAQDFNTVQTTSGFHFTGRIKAKKAFLRYLIQTMGCTEYTAKKRLNFAIKHRFLTDDGDSYLLVSSERLVKIACDQQVMAFDSRRSFIDPSLFFEDDRRYTIEARHLVDPVNTENTKALLYGVMAVYGNRYLWCRDTHAKIMRVSRRHTIRLTERANLLVEEQRLCVDPYSILHEAECNRVEAIEAIQKAEALYRTGGCKIRGRSLVQRRTIPDLDSDDFKTSLTIQLPNSYSNAFLIREVPASTPKVVVDSLSCIGTPGDSAEPIRHSSDSRSGVKRRELPAGGRKFLDARGLRETRKLSDGFVARYLTTLGEILADDNCRELVLSATGAKDILPLSYAKPVFHRGKIDRFRVTPYMLSEFASS